MLEHEIRFGFHHQPKGRVQALHGRLKTVEDMVEEHYYRAEYQGGKLCKTKIKALI